MTLPGRLRAPRRAAAFVLLAVNVACGGAGEPTRPADVASIVVSGVPATMMFVGDSVRLTATAVDAAGSVVANQQFVWTTSAPAVAAFRPNGMVLAIGGGRVTITASAGSHSGAVTIDVADSASLDANGGTLRAAAGLVTLTVPAGGLRQTTQIVVRPPATAPVDPRLVPGTAFEIGPVGLGLQLQATLAISYDPAQVPAGLDPASLRLCVLSGSEWVVVRNGKVDLATHTATGTILVGGVYAVRSVPVDHVTIAGATGGWGLYVGQSTTLHATAYLTFSDTVPTGPIVWSTSDASKVTVDASGTVRGLAAGTATITATAAGKSGSATVTVLSRPVADWSRATDWTTYQANARHSGYVDVTVDPAAFREQWVITPIAGVNYNPPTIGGGRLFLSTLATQQRLIALDAATGASLWTRDFGSIYGITQPTYDGGSVYAATGGQQDTYMYALNEADGTIRFQSPFVSNAERWRAPVVAGSSIVTPGGSGIVGFDRATGAQTFSVTGPRYENWTPAATNGLVYAPGFSNAGGIRGFDLTTGAVAAEVIDSRLYSVTTPVIGDMNDVLTITAGALVSLDLGAARTAWDGAISYRGIPVVGGGVAYAFDFDGLLVARRESDGALLWSWTPPQPSINLVGMALTNNVLFVTTSPGSSTAGVTYAIDLSSHLPVWSYPMTGAMALSKEGTLFIVQGPQVAAITLR